MTDILESWLQWTEGVTLMTSDGDFQQLTANHPAYPYAITAYYAGWRAAKDGA